MAKIKHDPRTVTPAIRSADGLPDYYKTKHFGRMVIARDEEGDVQIRVGYHGHDEAGAVLDMTPKDFSEDAAVQALVLSLINLIDPA